MGYTCCVPNCRSGYKEGRGKERKSSSGIRMFQFPSDPELKQKWFDAIPREDWKLLPGHRVCEKHFSPDDFAAISCDNNASRRNGRSSQRLSKPTLKKSAVPHLFPTLPNYLSKHKPKRRSINCCASVRYAQDKLMLERSNEEFMHKDIVEDFEMLKEKMISEVIPRGFATAHTAKCLYYHYVKVSDSVEDPLKLLASVAVADCFDVRVFIGSTALPRGAYDHLLNSGSLKTCSQLSNILALCKSLCDHDHSITKNDASLFLKLATSSLENYISAESKASNPEEQQVALATFILEQMRLMQVPKYGRRYPTNILMTAFLWRLTSNSLYKKLQTLIVLPSDTLLYKLTAEMNVKPGKIDVDYIKLRTDSLSEREKIVTLMIDEVYTAQRIEYSNGSFVGLTEDGLPAKTVLAFMVQSMFGKYKDIVCLIPVNKFDTKLLRKWFDAVMEKINEFLLVVAISTDNHVCNRKMFSELCGGQLKPSIEHPFRKGEKLFLLFDFTHNFKNIFNHFRNPCPDLKGAWERSIATS